MPFFELFQTVSDKICLVKQVVVKHAIIFEMPLIEMNPKLLSSALNMYTGFTLLLSWSWKHLARQLAQQCIHKYGETTRSKQESCCKTG